MPAPLLIIGGLTIGVMALLPNVEKFRNVDTFNDLIKAKSAKYGIPYVVLKGLVATESAFVPDAAAPTSSALGLTQVIRGTAESMGYAYETLTDPETSLDAGANYLSQQIKKFGLIGGIRAYYTGPRTYSYGTSGRLGELTTAQQKHFHDSLRYYVAKVMGYAARFTVRDMGEFV